MSADTLTASWACLQRSDRKCVTKVMQAMAATAGRRKACRFQESLECSVNIPISQGPAILIDEHVLTVGTRLSTTLQVTFYVCHGRRV